MTPEYQIQTLEKMKAGDMFELGALFESAAPEEHTVWQLLEVKKLKGKKRYTFNLYVFDCYFMPLIAMVTNDGKIDWSGKAISG